ncbi:MAG TPA: thioredoxin family protein [Actinoplanes sp.]|nr:thioredoxin family protein [Actinoplanes sp.]
MTSTGLIVAAAVLVIGTAVGVWRRRTDGRLRSVGPARPAVPATVAAGGERPRDVDKSAAEDNAPDGSMLISGVSRPGGEDRGAADPSAAGERINAELLAALGVESAQATLLQFSSAFCAPCRAVRRVSSEVAALLPGVRHVEVDAESHLDAVRALGIWRTPTLLVLDGDGRVAKRATGVPAKPQLIAVLGEILPAG